VQVMCNVKKIGRTRYIPLYRNPRLQQIACGRAGANKDGQKSFVFKAHGVPSPSNDSDLTHITPHDRKRLAVRSFTSAKHAGG
jgi:hypothetical protein